MPVNEQFTPLRGMTPDIPEAEARHAVRVVLRRVELGDFTPGEAATCLDMLGLTSIARDMRGAA